MKQSLSSIILAVLLLLFGWSQAISSETNVDGELKGRPFIIEQQEEDGEGELPDNPLLAETPETGTSAKQGREEAGILPNMDGGLTDKAKKVLEALRKALHESDTPDGFDIPVVLNEAVDRHIRCFTGPKRDIFARWLVRAERYAPTIKGILKKNGLPEDLVYLSMIESGFNMKARSQAKASGPWQFMHGTGKQYGLKVDYWVDERYDLEKSTVAAARYLKNLFDQFGCWWLAAASYNAGENRVKKAMEKQDTKDFWKLREYKTLPRETQEYVPQLIAAALIAKEPEKYGFSGLTSAPVYKLTKINVPGGIPLKGISRTLSLDLSELRALNPEILRGITPPNREQYQIKLPGTAEVDIAGKKLEANLINDRQVVGVVKHYVKKKDSLARIMKRYDVSRSELALVNDAVSARKGMCLYIPRFASAKKNATTFASEESEDRPTASRSHRGRLASLPQKHQDDVVTLAGPKKKSRLSQSPKLAAQTVKKSAKRTVAKPQKTTASRSKASPPNPSRIRKG